MRTSWFLSFGAWVVLAASWIFRPESLPAVPLCAFHRWTGLPCAGCGMTRAFCSLGHADFARAWELHPFSFAFYPLAIAVALWPLVEIVAPRASSKLDSRWFFGIWLVLALGIAIFGALRLWRAVHGERFEL